MSLNPGTRLGPYEILAPIGAGGMGEVYKAKDTRLDRIVAIKVLPEHLAENPERKQRFEREAKAISQLNHPHICTLYDVGEQDGIDYLVMEYIEGETLADALKKGPLPLDKALEYGAQIADGLDKAHRVGIVHRDLKPGNMMLTQSGAKLLDFGLAKPNAASQPSLADLSAIPTQDKPLTETGAIVGTVQYMAPEQLEGKQADARTDLFAFGAVLYEMVTGKKAFEGKSQLSVMTAILEKDPPPASSAQPVSPSALDHLLSVCLAKDPEDRWHSAGDVGRQLSWIADGGGDESAPTTPKAAASSVIGLGLAVLLSAAVTGAVFMRFDRPEPSVTTRVMVSLPESVELVVPIVPVLTLSPDGQWVGFFADGALMKVSLAGGRPVKLCQTPPSVYGGTWGADDTIVFAGGAGGSRLWHVLADGGVAELVPAKESEPEAGQPWPEMLPDGEHVLFTIWNGGLDTARVAIKSLVTGEQRVLTDGASPHLASDHLVFARADSLWAVRFDRDRLELVGSAVPVVERVEVNSITSAAQFAVAGDGSLVYVAGQTGALGPRIPVWVDRVGRENVVSVEQARFDDAAASPDGTRLALVKTTDAASDIWVYELTRGTLSRLTFDGRYNRSPTWSPDSKHIIFRSSGNRNGVFRKAADGTGPAERLTPTLVVDGAQSSIQGVSLSRDAKTLLVEQRTLEGGYDIYVLGVDKEGAVLEPLLHEPFHERAPTLSPDGRWLAYASIESGVSEIYVRPFPNVDDGKWLVSSSGGWSPVWRGDGRELFYRFGGAVFAVSIRPEPAFSAGSPELLFEVDWSSRADWVRRSLDVSLDGQRFLMLKTLGSQDRAVARQQIPVVLNWFNELERLVPAP